MAIRRGGDRHGFALVVTLSLLVLLMVVGLGVLSLSVIAMRSSQATRWNQQAQDNARLALLMAIGELQRSLGPDQRVSGTAGILAGTSGTVAQRHWTAVWPTRASDGQALVRRDPETGSLVDLRSQDGWDRWEQVRYLVSGNEGGGDRFRPERPPAGGEEVELVGEGTLGEDGDGQVVVPRVRVGANGDGNYAWWVGDLGVKANVASGAGDGEVAEPLIARRAEFGLFDPPMELADEDRERLGTFRTMALVEGSEEFERRFHDLTVDSLGVFADPRGGGLKKDLTAFLLGSGSEPPLEGGDDPGLTDNDRMVGPANEQVAGLTGEDWDASPFHDTAPRFGLLRGWAGLGSDSQEAVPAVPPKPEPDPRRPRLADYASANLNPSTIAELDTPNLVPVLVSGSIFSGPSYHDTASGSAYPFQLRLHIYPRFVLWNPYSVALDLDQTMVMAQVNGRKEIRMRGPRMQRSGDQWVAGGVPVTSRGLWVFGGRSTEFRDENNFVKTTGFNDPYMGSLYFSLPATRIGPGECLVFAPERPAEYDEDNLANNRLSCEVAPHPSRSFYFTDEDIDGGISFRPDLYWEMPPDESEMAWMTRLGWNLRNQADDFRMMLKSRDGRSVVDFGTFDELPQISFVSSTLQFGAGWEPRIAWADNRPMTMEQTSRGAPRPTLIPDVRTRQGIRLRWFDETASNLINSGALAASPHFESALLGNWNPRAAYGLRTPWENLAGPLPADDVIPDNGVTGGPWFFGAYTRDLFDPAVSWDNAAPVRNDGRYHGNPFGPAIEDPDPHIAFDAPPAAGRIASLARFQHAKLSEFIWHPSLALGQSLVDPRCGTTRTMPEFSGRGGAANRGWNAAMIGWSNDSQRSLGIDDWAAHGRAITQDYATSDALVYDLSFELNHALWDRYFLSTGSAEEKARFADDASSSPLPNSRMRLFSFGDSRTTDEELTDYHRAAAHLMLDGAFNVNSTSVEAWKALLSATHDPDTGLTRFPRLMRPEGAEWDGQSIDRSAIWTGGRVLTDDEVRTLAEAIVEQVETRGPFVSLADFVNRRLEDDESGMAGVLQAAIDASGINREVTDEWELNRSSDLPDYRHPDNIDDATLLDQRLKADSKAWGAPGYLTQGDVLQVIGPVLAARSDSFVVRAYGDALDAAGRVKARAWCEAIVQRVPDPLVADESGLNPVPVEDPGAEDAAVEGPRVDFGRRFVLRRFRWLQAEEI